MMGRLMSRVLDHPLRVPVSVGVVAFAAGTGLGYLLGKRNRAVEVHAVPSVDFEAKNAALSKIREELAEKRTKRDIALPIIEDERVPKDVVMLIKNVDEDEPDIITKSVFSSDDEWDDEKERADRDALHPYVIHKDEFHSEESGYTQTTLTYYAGDNIMVDEEDKPVYNYEDVTGPLRFGHGSGDANVFYVRNDKRRAEYEVLHDTGLYSEEILGVEIEDNQRAKDLKHSQPRKFKRE